MKVSKQRLWHTEFLCQSDEFSWHFCTVPVASDKEWSWVWTIQSREVMLAIIRKLIWEDRLQLDFRTLPGNSASECSTHQIISLMSFRCWYLPITLTHKAAPHTPLGFWTQYSLWLEYSSPICPCDPLLNLLQGFLKHQLLSESFPDNPFRISASPSTVSTA